MGVLGQTDGQKQGYLGEQMDRNRGTWAYRRAETGVLWYTDGQKQGYLDNNEGLTQTDETFYFRRKMKVRSQKQRKRRCVELYF